MIRALRVLAGLAVLAAVPSFAQTEILSDANSTARVNMTPGSGIGMDNWTVDGTNHLFQQWFWFRIGQTAERTIDQVGGMTFVKPLNNLLKVNYTDSIVKFETTYLLTGGNAGSGRSDIAESIRITNTSTTGYDLTFFQYTDFDMGGTAGGDTVTHVNANAFDQWDGVTGASETISTPVASHWEAGNFPGLLLSLTDNNPTTLLDIGSGTTGDCTFAWQWDIHLDAGGTFLISKDKNIVPEPATFLAIGAGLAALALRRRK